MIYKIKGWHLKEVVVESLEEKVLFPCNKWFDRKEGDGKIERDLFPNDHINDEKPQKLHNFIGSKYK